MTATERGRERKPQVTTYFFHLPAMVVLPVEASTRELAERQAASLLGQTQAIAPLGYDLELAGQSVLLRFEPFAAAEFIDTVADPPA